MESKKMNIGEKYLTIKMVGHENVAVFPNKEAREKNPKAPHYKGDGVAVWINEKKAPKTATVTNEDI